MYTGNSFSPSAAFAAHAAAHHLIGHSVGLCTVNDQRAVCLLAGTVIVKGALSRDIKGTSGEDQVGVGINCVRVTAAHYDLNITAGNLKCGRDLRRLVSCIDAVVRGLDTDRSAVHLNPGRFKPFVGCQVKFTVVDLMIVVA